MVAGVEVRGEDRLVLAAQDAGDLGGHPAEHEAFGVDDVPGTLDLAGFGGVRAYQGVNSPEKRTGKGYPPEWLKRAGVRQDPCGALTAGLRQPAAHVTRGVELQ